MNHSAFYFKLFIVLIHCYIDIIKDIYEGVAISVHLIRGMSVEFVITVGLHQYLYFIPYLFVLVIDELTMELQVEVLWSMLFAYDTVLVDDTKDSLSRKLNS